MLRGKLLAGILLVVVIIGCAKKKEQSDTEFSQSSKNTYQSQSSTADIFEEFYKEDTESPESSTPSSSSKQVSSSYDNTASSSEPPQFSSNGRYVVQISTVASRTLADRLVEKLEAKGYPAYVAEVQNPTPELFGTYYRVRIGRFAQVSTARDFGNETLKPLGYEFWVDNKANDNIGIEGSGFGETTPASDFNSGSSYQSYQTYPPAPEPSTPVETYTQPIPDQSAPTVNSSPVPDIPAMDNPPMPDQSSPAASYPPPPSVAPAPSIPSAEPAPVNAVTPSTPPQTPDVPLDDEW